MVLLITKYFLMSIRQKTILIMCFYLILIKIGLSSNIIECMSSTGGDMSDLEDYREDYFSEEQDSLTYQAAQQNAYNSRFYQDEASDYYDSELKALRREQVEDEKEMLANLETMFDDVNLQRSDAKYTLSELKEIPPMKGEFLNNADLDEESLDAILVRMLEEYQKKK